jgi:hypothetical protein
MSQVDLNLALYERKLALPEGFEMPTTLSFEHLIATAIGRDDLEDDVRGINASLDLIPVTRGGGWPTGPVTEEFNYVDLVWHELEFREGSSYTYVVRDVEGEYVGCAYLYPMGRRTTLSQRLLDRDVDVSWWVTPDRHARGDYVTLHRALRHWLANELPFAAAHFSNVDLGTTSA